MSSNQAFKPTFMKSHERGLTLALGMNSNQLKIEGGSAKLDSDGVSITPWFSKRPLHIPWQNIMFVSTTPSIRPSETGWTTWKKEAVTEQSIKNGQAIYLFALAIKERRNVAMSASRLNRAWLAMSLGFKPLLGANDKPDPSNAVVKLKFSRRWVRHHASEVIGALEIIRANSAFDLLVTLD